MATSTTKFADFEPGKWAVFFSRPADFTPVGTTELIYLAETYV